MSLNVSFLFLFLHFSGSIQLEVHLMPATNRFEVSENGNLAVSGGYFLFLLYVVFELKNFRPELIFNDSHFIELYNII